MSSIGPPIAGSTAADGQRGLRSGPSADGCHRSLLIAIYLALAVGTLAAFARVARYDFVYYDDDEMVFKNPHVKDGFTLDGLRFAFFDSNVGNWLPLTTLSQMLDCQVFGIKRPGLFHLENLLLHLVTVLLLFEALRRMTGEIWPSALVTALFAIHPLRVESVAWVTERKDVLSGMFWMLTMLCYASYARRPSVGRYLAIVSFYVLGLLSKPMLVTLPCVLVLLDYWPLRRWRPQWLGGGPVGGEGPEFSQAAFGRLLLEKIPLFVLATGAAVCEARAQIWIGSASSFSAMPVKWRLVNAATSYAIYLWKTVWPTGLAVFYPHPSGLPGADIANWIWPAVGAGALLAGVSLIAVLSARRWPYLIVGWLWYLGTLLPVIGFFQVGAQARADRFTYLPMIGIYLALAWGARDLVARFRGLRYPVSLAAAAAVVALSALSWVQVGYWRNSETLFKHALSVSDANYVIHHNLGIYLAEHDRAEEAIPHYERALQLNPAYDSAENNLGAALIGLGRPGEAIPHCRRALALKHDFPAAHINLGVALLDTGLYREAIQQFELGLKSKHDDPYAESNLGSALLRTGKAEQAIPHFDAALKLKDDDPKTHTDLGEALLVLGKVPEAIEQYRRALSLEKGSFAAHYNLANALNVGGKVNEAIEQFQQAIRRKSDSYRAHFNLGRTLQLAGRGKEAVAHFKRVLELKPNYPDAEISLSFALSDAGDAPGAIQHAENACRLTGDRNPEYLYALADAFAAASRMNDAVAAAQKAILVARSQGQVQLAREIEATLSRYKADRR